MPSPAVNVFDMKKGPVCVCENTFACNGFSRCQSFCVRYCCLRHLLAWSHLTAASAPVPQPHFKDKLTLQGRYTSTGLSMRISTEVCHTWHMNCHSSSSFIVIRQPHPASFIVHHQDHSSSFLYRHSSTSSIIFRLTLSCYLLLPNSFPLPPPAFLSGHTVG